MKKNILLVNDTSLVCHHGCTLLMQCIYELFKKNNIIVKDRILQIIYQKKSILI